MVNQLWTSIGLSLPDRSGFEMRMELILPVSSPRVPVIVLTRIPYRAVCELAKQQGAQACLLKTFTSGEDLDKAIQPKTKEDRYRPR